MHQPLTGNTDNFRSYRGLTNYGFTYLTVNHSVGEYVKNQVHTNGIESFWSLLKRGYYCIHHYMSEKHLHHNVKEFSFRHNTSQISAMNFINLTIKGMGNKRLTYMELINVLKA